MSTGKKLRKRMPMILNEELRPSNCSRVVKTKDSVEKESRPEFRRKLITSTAMLLRTDTNTGEKIGEITSNRKV